LVSSSTISRYLKRDDVVVEVVVVVAAVPAVGVHHRRDLVPHRAAEEVHHAAVVLDLGLDAILFLHCPEQPASLAEEVHHETGVVARIEHADEGDVGRPEPLRPQLAERLQRLPAIPVHHHHVPVDHGVPRDDVPVAAEVTEHGDGVLQAPVLAVRTCR
jgi:hypothetical protein